LIQNNIFFPIYSPLFINEICFQSPLPISARLRSMPIADEPSANFIIIDKTGRLTVVELGMFGQPELTEDQLARIKGCDVLLMSTLSGRNKM